MYAYTYVYLSQDLFTSIIQNIHEWAQNKLRRCDIILNHTN